MFKHIVAIIFLFLSFMVVAAGDPGRGKGLTHLSFGLSTYVPDPVKKRRSMELFAKELLPEVKTW